jgi:phosphate transport system substrate-binding protein
VAEKANIDPKGLNQFPLVDARLVFIVHPSKPVKALTIEQVKGVMAGTITNWKELGGADLVIVGVVETSGGGVRMATVEGVMHGAPVAATIKAVKGDKIAGLVKTTPGALGVASSMHNNLGTVALSADKSVPQMLVLVVKGAATPAIQKLVVAARAAAKS